MIRSAFLKKSKENHPDRNPDDKDAQERMAKVFQANSVLTDPKKKAVYDQLGSKVLEQICHEDMHLSFHFQGLRAGELRESFDRVNRVTFFLLNVSGALRDPTMAGEA